MISSSHKFPLRTKFLEFKKRAQKNAFSQVLIYSSPSEVSRLGVIVPKKVNKLATSRNYIRRLTYHTLWPHIKDHKIDVVVVFKPLSLLKNTQSKEIIVTQLTRYVQTLS